MSQRRLTSDDAEKIVGRATIDPQTTEAKLAAQAEAARDRVQIHVKVARKTRQTLKVLADGAETSYQQLAEQFILDGIASAKSELGKGRKS